jgi:Na+(H+)/acetate symporter ActP
MKKKCLVLVMIIVLLAMFAGNALAEERLSTGTGDFYADGGLVGMVGNGLAHEVNDPIGATATAVGTMGDLVIKGAGHLLNVLFGK